MPEAIALIEKYRSNERKEEGFGKSIAKMMGHTNICTTQGYAKVTDDKISEDMDRLIENMKK